MPDFFKQMCQVIAESGEKSGNFSPELVYKSDYQTSSIKYAVRYFVKYGYVRRKYKACLTVTLVKLPNGLTQLFAVSSSNDQSIIDHDSSISLLNKIKQLF